ncbi:hypothetical protein Cni_G28500 [Canna indica]|uniref:BHLH domain-containing protein n=1 Tax=Canna indica TaxID=4628 RepID=A0AAQ3L2T8_9LILI|nr:hypothetical protein Cni_G28500 [Canna indica]
MGVHSTSVKRIGRTVLQLREKNPVKPKVRRKLRKLRKIIPGCHAVGLDELLQRTAEHISFLELQVIILRRKSNPHGASGYVFS